MGATDRRSPEQILAEIFLHLEKQGCHNINLVTPTHQIAAIMDALTIAAGQGLSIPIVYNTGGYDNPEVLRLLDGVIDIYMPDAKFFRGETATAQGCMIIRVSCRRHSGRCTGRPVIS